ncbi:hypothetical protein TREAZ_3020 [Leadbettera azotonutricia ZAS-9]|uniref:Uncharacterized protein n=1 Tax=Leadbettera azotonutricia (strain ATCC BAA-888 / DSM 13862 / ZAS-9) TaxID=545695 RepID=F5YB49_LEAAZ|nr:hypothetical protein TREAZ_3020 [Leadbettera azotonutricia ZAS-9]
MGGSTDRPHIEDTKLKIKGNSFSQEFSRISTFFDGNGLITFKCN